jgi:PIN domain-containing protein
VTEPPPLRLFLDRSTNGRRFIDGIRRLVDDVETIGDRYGVRPAEDIKDPRWIADATAAGRILLGADKRILRSPVERRAVCRADARYIVFGSGNLSDSQLLKLFEQNLPAIHLLTSVPGPWVQRIARHGMERLPLNCSDC